MAIKLSFKIKDAIIIPTSEGDEQSKEFCKEVNDMQDKNGEMQITFSPFKQIDELKDGYIGYLPATLKIKIRSMTYLCDIEK